MINYENDQRGDDEWVALMNTFLEKGKPLTVLFLCCTNFAINFIFIKNTYIYYYS